MMLLTAQVGAAVNSIRPTQLSSGAELRHGIAQLLLVPTCAHDGAVGP
jgi:hypothetical protein